MVTKMSEEEMTDRSSDAVKYQKAIEAVKKYVHFLDEIPSAYHLQKDQTTALNSDREIYITLLEMYEDFENGTTIRDIWFIVNGDLRHKHDSGYYPCDVGIERKLFNQILLTTLELL
jgi:hypothetical protein